MKKIGIAIIIILLISAVGLTFFIKNLYPVRYYETNWNIDIPDSAVEEYYAETVPSPNGEGVKYSVLTVGKEEIFFKDFNEKKNEEFESKVKSIMKQIDSDERYHPDFSKDYLWSVKTTVDDSIYMLFDAESEKLFIIADIW